jgi:hypothetical protein
MKKKLNIHTKSVKVTNFVKDLMASAKPNIGGLFPIIPFATLPTVHFPISLLHFLGYVSLCVEEMSHD